MAGRPSQSKQDELARQQLELKNQILEEALKALRKPWYRKPRVLFGAIGATGAAITAAVAILGLMAGNKKLDNEIAAGERQLRGMKVEEAKTNAELNAKQLHLDMADDEYARLTEKIDALKTEVAASDPDLLGSLEVFQADIRTARDALPKADLNACALSESGLFVAVGQAGAIVISPDLGQTWRSPERPVEVDLLDVACSADGKVIVAVGRGGILVSRDDGQSWTLTKKDRLSPRVACSTDGEYLWVVDIDGLHHSSDSGAHWNRPSGGPASFVLSLDHGRALVPRKSLLLGLYGVEIYRSDNLGSPTVLREFSVNSLGSISALSAATPTEFWIAVWEEFKGVGLLLRSLDEGKTWGSLPAVGVPHIRSLWVSPNQTKLAAVTADGRWAISDNSGNSWNYQSLDSSETMTDIAGSSDGRLLCCVGKKGVILWSTDGGQSWTRPTYPRPGMRSSD
jgi:photosystem II stability/assembly factor-like uncharacterized protein